MSQARHAMGGPSHVSSLQYDCNMKPLVKVSVETNSSSSSSYDDLISHSQVPSKGMLQLDFDLEWTNPERKCIGKSERVGDSDGMEEASVRRRKVEESIEEVPMEKRDTDGGGGEEMLKDPLLWFGVLVPQSLRHSQQLFKQGICKYAV